MRERVHDLRRGGGILGASNRRIVPIRALKWSERVAWWDVATKRRCIGSKNIAKAAISDYPQDTFTSSLDKSFLYF
jgi:hypothetical protein